MMVYQFLPEKLDKFLLFALLIDLTAQFPPRMNLIVHVFLDSGITSWM